MYQRVVQYIMSEVSAEMLKTFVIQTMMKYLLKSQRGLQLVSRYVCIIYSVPVILILTKHVFHGAVITQLKKPIFTRSFRRSSSASSLIGDNGGRVWPMSMSSNLRTAFDIAGTLVTVAHIT